MKLKVTRPSPALCVASVALFVSLGGTSVAAVSYVQNAGAVDGKSAVSSSTTLRHGAGKLVATAKGGPHKGKLPGKWVADVARSQAFGRSLDVADNTPGAAQTLATLPGFGTLTVACNDRQPKPGNELPGTLLSFANSSGQPMNSTRTRGNDFIAISPLGNGAVAQVGTGITSTFSFQLQQGATNVLVEGSVRHDGASTANAKCLVYGTVLHVVQ